MDKELEDFLEYFNNGEQVSKLEMSVSVIMPFYNQWTMTHRRMMELYEQVSTPIEIILVDDCSTEDVTGGHGWWKQQNKHRVKCIKTPKNLGFGGAMNLGCHVATEDVYILLSNDVQVLGNFIPEIVQKLQDNPKSLIGNEIMNWDTGWNVLNINGKPKMFPYLGGYLLACTSEAWRDLGGFDDIYKKFDYEDVDLSTIAIYKGYDLIPLNSRKVRHFSGQTVRKHYPNREDYTRINRQRFIKKWSKILKDE